MGMSDLCQIAWLSVCINDPNCIGLLKYLDIVLKDRNERMLISAYCTAYELDIYTKSKLFQIKSREIYMDLEISYGRSTRQRCLNPKFTKKDPFQAHVLCVFETAVRLRLVLGLCRLALGETS